MRYSLSDYIATVSIPNNVKSVLGFTDPTLSFGGEGSYLGHISVSQRNDTWRTEGDNTGSWVHIKNLDRTGEVRISLNMLSPKTIQLTKLFNLYYNSDIVDEGVEITISNAASSIIVTCIDCYITRMPELDISDEPGTREWVFTCGKVVINQL